MNGFGIAGVTGAKYRILAGACALVLLVLGLCASLQTIAPGRAYADDDITGATVALTELKEATYNGETIYNKSDKKPAMTVTLASTDITEKCGPYYCIVKQPESEEPVEVIKNAGTYHVHATATASGYTGTTDNYDTFTVNKASATAKADPSTLTVVYGDTGKITISGENCDIGDIDKVTASVDGVVTSNVSGKTITVTPLKIGSTVLTIKVKPDPNGNYEASADVTVPVTVSAISLSNATISPNPIPDQKQEYTGQAMTPSVTVTYRNVKLSPGTDYTINYSNNNVAGAQAQMEIIAKAGGLCTGATVKTFLVVGPTPSQDNWKITPYATVNGSEKAKATLKDNTLTMTYDGYKHGIAVSTNIAGAVVTYSPANSTIRDAGNLTVNYTATDPSGVNVTKTGKVKLVINPLKTLKTKVDSGTVTLEGDSTFGKLSHGGKIVSLVVDEVSASGDSNDKSYVSKLKATYGKSNSSSEFKVYDVRLVRHAVSESVKKGTDLYEDFGKVKISFPLGKKYAGETAHVVELHEQRNSSGKVTGTKVINLGNSLTVAKDGTVSVTVDKLSDFVVALGKGSSSSSNSSNSNNTRGTTGSNTTASGKAAKTGDSLHCVGPLTMTAIVAMALSVVACMRLRRLRG